MRKMGSWSRHFCSMPLLMTKIEGKGNGIKTVVPNMSDVARALSRPPTYPTKFFGCELGAQTSFDEKNDRYIVNGAHDATKLRELLDAFIDKFVLCKSCKNPETDLLITKSEEIIRDCKACGERTGIDMRHKLTTFILKNPPKTARKGKSKKNSGAESPSNNGTHAEAAGPSIDDEADGQSDDELMKRIKSEAADLNADSALAKEDWSIDTSPEAVRARTKAAESAMANLALGDDDSDDDADSPLGQLGRWVQENRAVGPVEIYKKADELGVAKKHKAVQIIAQNLFGESIVSEIAVYAPVFVKVCFVHLEAPAVADSRIHRWLLQRNIKSPFLAVLRSLWETCSPTSYLRCPRSSWSSIKLTSWKRKLSSSGVLMLVRSMLTRRLARRLGRRANHSLR